MVLVVDSGVGNGCCFLVRVDRMELVTVESRSILFPTKDPLSASREGTVSRASFGRADGCGVIAGGGRRPRELETEVGLEVEVEAEVEEFEVGVRVGVEAEAEAELKEVEEVEAETAAEVKCEAELGRCAAERACGPRPGVEEAAAGDEMEAGERLLGSGAAGSGGAAGCSCLMLCSSQPRCSPRLLRVMESDRNNRSKFNPHASASQVSGDSLGGNEVDEAARAGEGECLVEWGFDQ